MSNHRVAPNNRTATVRERNRPPWTVPAAILAAAAPALADGTATWLWDVTTPNGDQLVEPGETATITLSMLMEVDPGDGPVAALASVDFDVLSGGGVIEGWSYHHNLEELTGDLATTDGVNIYGAHAAQLTSFGPFTEDNPVDVFTFQWTPDAYVPHEQTFVTASDYEGLPAMVVWEGEHIEISDPVIYPVIDAAISITVVPAPATALLFTIFTLNRQRRLRI